MNDTSQTTPTTPSFLTVRDYQDAIDVQSAVNLSGVVFSFARVMQKICDEGQRLGKGTQWRNHHPIAVLYAYEISWLTNQAEGSSEVWQQAYDAAEEFVASWQAPDKEGCGYCGKDHPNDACPEVK
jgi:hypothetical protein